ncbi:Uncharacterized protein FWK35_00038088 [Aphis craccivora]|uniref:Uncharacterized protein n=1 Tax=Aphis craccivora TaxID=307492 RepID=A0A6G0XZ58_APHCR|nr:Uncharacterized protein FWK35_00038088 [Aphis craccivora]
MHSNIAQSQYFLILYTSFNLYSLVNRLRYADICFLSKLVNGVISCPELLQLINFDVPKFHSRFHHTFEIPFHCTLLIDRIDIECNNLKNVDFFIVYI